MAVFDTTRNDKDQIKMKALELPQHLSMFFFLNPQRQLTSQLEVKSGGN